MKGVRQMTLPENLPVDFTAYSHLTFLPLGRKNKSIRSVGSKHTKGLLGRLNDYFERAMNELSQEDIVIFQTFLYGSHRGGFPVAIDKNEDVYPHFWKPTSFLWKEYNKNLGIPIHHDEFYSQDFTVLTKNELESYLGSIMKDYIFCARIHDSSKEEWIQHINKCFLKHPLISLYHRNADVIEAIEQSKKSPLLFIMKNPEQIAFWRNRIEIIMRPFRSLSYAAFERGFSDTEDTVLTVHGENEIIRLTSENRGLAVTYDVTNDAISLDDEYNVVLAAKRLATTQRQFEEIIDENEEVIQKLLVFFKWKSLLKHHEVHIKEIQDKLCSLTTYQLNQRQVLQENDHFLSFIQKVLQVKTPNANLEVGSIQWFSQWDFPDVTLLQETNKSTCCMDPNEVEKKLTEISAKIENELHKQRQDLLSTPLKIGQIPFDSNQMLRLLTLIDTLKNTETQQSYVQILEGVSTNSIRQKELDKIPAFGLLNSVKRKRIVTYLQELQNYQLLKKEKKGFSLTPKGEAIRRLFEEESRRI